MNYQPILGTDAPFQRRCEDRYAPIKDLASKFKRPFSVLDIGANYGWFAFKLMQDFDCTAVLVDDKPIGDLIPKFAPERTVWINRHLSGRDLQQLAKSEHFDIVLSLSVLHHFPDYERAFDAMRNLGTFAFFEIPGVGDVNAANKEAHNAIRWLFTDYEPIAWFDSHVSKAKRPMYLIESEPSLIEQSIDARERGAPSYGSYRITSTFERSSIHIHREGRPHLTEDRQFVPGMNVHNFQLLGGAYPTKETLDREMAKHAHPDKRPWNFIVGYGVTPIDTVRKW